MASAGDNSPWEWEAWRGHTMLEHAPFSKDALVDPPKGWTKELVSAVHAFASNYWALPDSQLIPYLRRIKDNDSIGRNTWIDFVNKGWNKTWRIHDLIDEQLIEHHIHPYAVMRRLKLNTVSPIIYFSL
jgi:hypothetical protein